MATTAPIHKNRTTTLGRISGYLSTNNLFRDSNLGTLIYPAAEIVPLTSLTKWSMEFTGHGDWLNHTFEDVINQVFEDTKIGDSFGPTWSTHWFKLEITVPDSFVGKEVHLRWNSNTEGTVWSTDGKVLQGLSPGYREEYIISRKWVAGPPFILYVEISCNGMFGAGEGDNIAPPNPNKLFQLQKADIAVFDRSVYKVYTDLEVLYQMGDRLSGEHIGYQALFAANEMVNDLRRGDFVAAGRIADIFFSEGNGQKAHRLISMGHCHIDTAWLWPYDETIRKCARSWSAQIQLMKEYPQYVFTCSQAQQFDWMKQYYPPLYEEIKASVASGKFVPVGGTWIEMDGNIPSGEAFMRQFFYGQRFFQQEFNLLCKEFWLPDTFGYSAQIPQMIKHVGVERFMTQKMSWNLVNKFPNHNFWWEGIDGTEVLVHFPPGNSYNMNGTVEEILFSQNNSEDKGRANVGIYLYGYGDGGGGPTRTMIERQQRLQDVDGIPKIEFGTPEYFWEELEKESSKLYRWVGELYLELHNGTYTTQSKIKWYNRKCEFLFREVELILAIAYSTGKVNEVQLRADVLEVDTCWKDFLLNQFHDVLPGSCIELITLDAWKLYENIFIKMLALKARYNTLILGTGTTQYGFNPLSWDLRTVVFNKPDAGTGLSGDNVQTVTLQAEELEESPEGRYRIPNTFGAALVDLKASGYSSLVPIAPPVPVTHTSAAGVGTFNNGKIRLEYTETGRPSETLYFTGPSGTEHVVYNDLKNTGTEPGMYYIYDDIPLYWDAWDVMDYHMETRRLPDFSGETTTAPFGTGPIVGGYKWSATFGNGSTLTRHTIIRADSPMIEYFLVVDWKEKHKFLKVEFPVDILSREATYEIQYGHANRPTHINTSWDMAKYEVCGHKWMDISQADKGVTFITDSKYGWNVRGNIVRMSLLRAPKNPDANADIHKHFIHYAVLPHEGTFQESEVIRRAYELNFLGANNVNVLSGAATPAPSTNWVTPDHEAVIVEAFKPAHDIPNALLVRLYESYGGGAKTTINLGFTPTAVNVCNGLEALGEDVPIVGNSFEATFTPFQIKSFIVYFPPTKV